MTDARRSVAAHRASIWVDPAAPCVGKRPWIFLPPLLLLLISPAYGDYRVQWHVDGTLQEQYDDNIGLSSTDPQADWITILSPGGDLLVESKTGRLLFDYHLNANFYANNPVLNYLGHTANLNVQQALWKHFTFRLRDSFIRSDAPREESVPDVAPDVPQATEFLLGTRLQRSPYMRNSFIPSLEYQYGKDDFLRLGYRNELYVREVESSRDIRDTFNLGVDHWFGPQYGLLFTLDYLRTHFQTSSDFDGQDATLIPKWRLDPLTTLFAQMEFSNRDFHDETTNYRIYRASLGVEHSFSPLISGRLRGGYFFLVPVKGATDGGLVGELSVTARWLHLQGSAYVRTGATESFLDAENLGFSKFWAFGAAGRYQATQRITLTLDASYNINEFPSGESRTTWQARVGGSAILLKWLTGSVDLFHQEELPGEEGGGFKDNRITFRLTARY